MKKVVAIQKTDSSDKTIYIFGYGKFIGNKVPDTAPFNKIGVDNPCIKITKGINKGKYIWGFQCWWGDVETEGWRKMKSQFEKIEEVEMGDIEVLPLVES